MFKLLQRVLVATTACLAVGAPVGLVQASDPDAIRPGAIHVTLPKGAAQAHAAASADNLNYLGGPVESQGSANYAIFWDPAVGTKKQTLSPRYNSLITRFLQDVGGSSIMNTSTEYYGIANGVTTFIPNGAHFGGSTVDTSLYPGPVIEDLELQKAVLRNVKAKHWPAGIGNEFFIFTNKYEILCATNGCSNSVWCAYHGHFFNAGTTYLYAVFPYPTTTPAGCTTPTAPNGDLAADSVMNVMSHELWETITDPLVITNPAWNDQFGQEGSDKCNFTFGATDGRGADTYMNGHPYILQQEWRNSAGGCVMS